MITKTALTVKYRQGCSFLNLFVFTTLLELSPTNINQ